VSKFEINKSERLKHKKEIHSLFIRENYLNVSPFKTIYQVNLSAPKFSLKFLISVPKAKIKHSVKRNLVKRRIKEAYRKNKHILLNAFEEKNIKINIAFVYNTDVILKYDIIESKIILILQRLKIIIEKNVKQNTYITD